MRVISTLYPNERCHEMVNSSRQTGRHSVGCCYYCCWHKYQMHICIGISSCLLIFCFRHCWSFYIYLFTPLWHFAVCMCYGLGRVGASLPSRIKDDAHVCRLASNGITKAAVARPTEKYLNWDYDASLSIIVSTFMSCQHAFLTQRVSTICLVAFLHCWTAPLTTLLSSASFLTLLQSKRSGRNIIHI